MGSDLQKQLSAALPHLAQDSLHREGHLHLFDAEGRLHPPHNYASVINTYLRFKEEFWPQCPLIDPLGNRVKIRLLNFPKLLNLQVRAGFAPKNPGTIVEMLESGRFIEDQYEYETDRKQALFWLPDVIRDPDAIYKKNRSHGKIPADKVYIKIYKVDGSPVKVAFTERVGKPGRQSIILVTSYLTSRTTAKKYIDGFPLYVRPKEKPPTSG